MCACEPGWTCPRCRDTPSDHRYELNEPEVFEDLVGERFTEQDA